MNRQQQRSGDGWGGEAQGRRFISGRYVIEWSLGKADREQTYLVHNKQDAAPCRALAGNA